MTPDDAAPDLRVGLRVVHRRYVPHSHAHYAGDLVDGAYSLGLFGDVATEVCIRTDGDEGLFAGYADVRFLAPVRAGDVLEVEAVVTRVGRRSRELALRVLVVCRGTPERGTSAAAVLDPPVVATTATGTVVVPAAGTVSNEPPHPSDTPGRHADDPEKSPESSLEGVAGHPS